MSVKRRFSTRWGHPYHLQGACTECRQTLLHPLCSITPMTLESYTEYSAQSKREDTSEFIFGEQDNATWSGECFERPFAGVRPFHHGGRDDRSRPGIHPIQDLE